MIVAQISDLHVSAPGEMAFGRIDTAACLARCVSSILMLRPSPEMVVASGDLVNAGASEEYRRLRDILAPLSMPVYLMAGNHDERAALRAEFRDHTYLPLHGTLHYAVDTEAVRLLMLDTVIPGKDGGALDSRQMEWLDIELGAAPDRPVVIFMHHPPITTGIRGMDDIALDARDISRLAGLVAASPKIERIACGHVHRKIESRWAGTTVSVCPSTAYQIGLSFDGGTLEPSEEPPSYQLHYWNGAELVTHTIAVGLD
jgi:3',5'-cyclic AMP phosphodiesterase CpdA